MNFVVFILTPVKVKPPCQHDLFPFKQKPLEITWRLRVYTYGGLAASETVIIGCFFSWFFFPCSF